MLFSEYDIVFQPSVGRDTADTRNIFKCFERTIVILTLVGAPVVNFVHKLSVGCRIVLETLAQEFTAPLSSRSVCRHIMADRVAQSQRHLVSDSTHFPARKYETVCRLGFKLFSINQSRKAQAISYIFSKVLVLPPE